MGYPDYGGVYMGFSEDFTDVASKVLSDVSDKAKELGNNSKLSVDKKKASMELSKMYLELGRRYYEENKDSADEDIEAITIKRAEIKKLNDQIIKNKGGKPCPSCGKIVEKDADFCPKCGEKLN